MVPRAPHGPICTAPPSCPGGCIVVSFGAAWLQHFSRVRPSSSAMGHGGRSWSLSPVQWRCVGHLVGLLPPVLHCVLKMGRVLWGTGRGSPGEHCFVPTCHLSDVPRVLVTLQHISPNSANCNTCMQRWGCSLGVVVGQGLALAAVALSQVRAEGKGFIHPLP